MKQTIPLDAKGARLIAHRGLSGLETENTLPAFLAAAQRNYWGIETDVRRTADGRYVLLHDGNTSRVAPDFPALTPEEVTFDELRALQLRDKGELSTRPDLRIASLEEYIHICHAYGKQSVLELKGDFTREQLEEILAKFADRGHYWQVTIISFNYSNFPILRKIAPLIPAQFLIGNEIPGEFGDIEGLASTLSSLDLGLDAWFGFFTQSRVKVLKDHGIALNAWTVDDPAAAANLASLGVSFITSNIIEPRFL